MVIDSNILAIGKGAEEKNRREPFDPVTDSAKAISEFVLVKRKKKAAEKKFVVCWRTAKMNDRQLK